VTRNQGLRLLAWRDNRFRWNWISKVPKVSNLYILKILIFGGDAPRALLKLLQLAPMFKPLDLNDPGDLDQLTSSQVQI